MKKIFYSKMLWQLLFLLLPVSALLAQVEQKFELPPKEILALADIKPRAGALIDDKAEYMILTQRNSMYKSLPELAEVEFKLAGLRINPKNFGPSRTNYVNSLEVVNIKTGAKTQVSGLPQNALLGGFSFSPNQKKMAFYNNTGNALELWVLDIVSATAKKVNSGKLNMVIGGAYQWIDNENLLVKQVSENAGKLIEGEVMPNGPVVQESTGKRAPNRTFQDLLKNPTDEANFEYFAKVNLVKVSLSGTQQTVLSNQLIQSYTMSPDRKYMLIELVERPYSYVVPFNRFPINISVYDFDGKKVFNVANLPLEEERPAAFDATRKGPRSIRWRPDMPASIYWVEALDNGDPAVNVPFRDALYALDAPFTGEKMEIGKTENRYQYVQWGNNNIAIMFDYRWKDRKSKTYLIDITAKPFKTTVIADRNTEDLYTEPGDFQTVKNAMNQYVLKFSKNGKKLYLVGEGYSPEGNKPFLDEYDIAAKTTKRLWRADGLSTYEQIIDIIDYEKGILLTAIESKTENMNYYIRTIGAKAPVKITNFPHPYESFKNVYKEKIRYKREDGVELSATLYLPADYDRKSGKKLPMIMWAYPKEFKSADAAGQVSTSPHEFTYLSYGTPIYWAAAGYAILDDADFPIIGEGTAEPNDSFIKQLVANAKAAIDAVDALGYIDRTKVGVGGHSYGAFMTANLLTHSNLFACGVARSGAYNRTLTPFGFQAEERTYWEATNVYTEMSPFTFADKMKTPMLLIHGNADNNPGTFTLQSERYFQALKGHGAVARLVLLPFESHGYASRENIMHVLWEQDQWFKKYLKN